MVENPYLLLTPGPLSTTLSVKEVMLRDWCTWDDDYNRDIVQVIRRKLVELATRAEGYTSVLMQGSGTFVVEEIGSGPILYEFNVGLDVGADGTPVLSYYDHNAQSLIFARRTGSGWDLATVDAGPDSGKYSDVVLDDQGRAHISYLIQTGANSGTIGYAVEDGTGGWLLEDAGEITQLETGHFGARRVTSIDVVEGVPHIVFSDRSGVWLATRGDSGWSVDQILTAGAVPLGQLVSLEIGGDGVHHIAYWEQTSDETGVIGYLTNG